MKKQDTCLTPTQKEKPKKPEIIKENKENIADQFKEIGTITESLIKLLEKQREDVITKDDAKVIVLQLMPEIDKLITTRVKQHILAVLNVLKLYESRLIKELENA